MTELFEDRKIHNQIPDGNAHAGFFVSRFKDAERKILDWEMGIGGNVDE